MDQIISYLLQVNILKRYKNNRNKPAESGQLKKCTPNPAHSVNWTLRHVTGLPLSTYFLAKECKFCSKSYQLKTRISKYTEDRLTRENFHSVERQSCDVKICNPRLTVSHQNPWLQELTRTTVVIYFILFFAISVLKSELQQEKTKHSTLNYVWKTFQEQHRQNI